MNTTSEPITTTYLFTFEKHSKKNNETFWEIKKNGEMGWVMQKNGERKKFQELVKNSPLLISFSILVSDHLVLLEGEFTNKYTSEKSKETINRLSGEWRYEATSYDKNKEPIDGEIERTMSITGTCGAAKPKF